MQSFVLEEFNFIPLSCISVNIVWFYGLDYTIVADLLLLQSFNLLNCQLFTEIFLLTTIIIEYKLDIQVTYAIKKVKEI